MTARSWSFNAPGHNFRSTGGMLVDQHPPLALSKPDRLARHEILYTSHRHPHPDVPEYRLSTVHLAEKQRRDINRCIQQSPRIVAKIQNQTFFPGSIKILQILAQLARRFFGKTGNSNIANRIREIDFGSGFHIDLVTDDNKIKRFGNALPFNCYFNRRANLPPDFYSFAASGESTGISFSATPSSLIIRSPACNPAR